MIDRKTQEFYSHYIKSESDWAAIQEFHDDCLLAAAQEAKARRIEETDTIVEGCSKENVFDAAYAAYIESEEGTDTLIETIWGEHSAYQMAA